MYDLEICRLRKDHREIRVVVCDATSAQGDYLGVELRVEQDGAVYLKELRQTTGEMERRTAELLKNLEAVGWTPSITNQQH